MNHHQFFPQTICVPQHLVLQQEDQYIPGMIQNNHSQEERRIQYPAPMALQLTDSIHGQVQAMLSKSRLTRKCQNNIRLMKPTDFVHRRVLGAGAFSQVSAVQVAHSNKLLACKHLKPDLMKEPTQFRAAAAELAYEAHMLCSMDHPHILKIRGWAENGIASFDAGRHDSFFLLLDMLDETLDARIQRWNHQHSSSIDVLLDKLRVLTELASALHYVHEQGIVFRDLKPDNVGFKEDAVQLFDFGLSRELPTLDTTTPYQMSGQVGTIRYMAPEVVLHQPYNVSADVYSWSMVAYEVLVGDKPYQGLTPELHADYVCRSGLRPNVATLRDDLAMLLQQTWHADPSQRLSLPQIMMRLQQMAMTIQAEQQYHQCQQQPTEIYIDLNDVPFFLRQQQPPSQSQHRSKLRRCHSSESIGTIETGSMSAESLDWW